MNTVLTVLAIWCGLSALLGSAWAAIRHIEGDRR